MDRFLLDAFAGLSGKYIKRLKECRGNINEESVHDLRIAARRLLSLIELFRGLTPETKLGKLRQTLKDQLDSFDDLRDTQVMLLEISDRLEILPELTHFKLHLQHRENTLLLQNRVFIKGIGNNTVKRKLKKAFNRCKRMAARRNIAQAEVMGVIGRLHATAVNRAESVDPTNLPTIHHLRIAVKKLRYLLAATKPLLTDYPESRLARMKDYVTLMGEIQNSAVLYGNLETYYVSGVPDRVRSFYQRRQQELLDAFMLGKDEVIGFWTESNKEPSQRVERDGF